jgi:anthranilate phosphoribosyltransferase
VAQTWPGLLSSLLAGQSLTTEDTAWVMRQVMSGTATPAQTAAFLVALRAKGETADEVQGFVDVMLEYAHLIDVPGRLVDTCGTGGDRSHTVNISTMSALVVAGAGISVVKHGNRAASSSCGAADVLEALGVVVSLPPAAVAQCVVDAGIGFCFAQVFHPGMRHAGPVRAEIGVPTVFNILGPLCNPARVQAQALGCADARLAPVMASVLAARGADALVFRGSDGLDELTTTGPSTVWVVAGGSVTSTEVDPADLGVRRATLDELRGSDAAGNAAVVRDLVVGKPGPVRDAVVLNAAASFAAYEALDLPLLDRLRAGMERANESIDSGAASAALERWATVSQRLAPAS